LEKIIISGQVNVETTLKVNGFPIHYNAVNFPFFGINATVSGVGVNIASGLKALGRESVFAAIVGRDMQADSILADLQKREINTDYVLPLLKNTPQSIIIYDQDGKRQIYNDLKDIQDTDYPLQSFEEAANEAEVAILCNINHSRPFLKTSNDLGLLVCTDVHTIADPEDEYNADFMKYANVLFCSNEEIQGHEKEMAKEMHKLYSNELIVIGMGKEGALLFQGRTNRTTIVPAVKTRNIISTIGAGDALFTGFIDGYLRYKNAEEALKRAMLFASYKIGAAGAAEGFPSKELLQELVAETYV